jgi:hypothetical protein
MVYGREGSQRDREGCERQHEDEPCGGRSAEEIAADQPGERKRCSQEQDRREPKPFQAAGPRQREVLQVEVERPAAPVHEDVVRDLGPRPGGQLERRTLVHVERLPPDRRQRGREREENPGTAGESRQRRGPPEPGSTHLRGG